MRRSLAGRRNQARYGVLYSGRCWESREKKEARQDKRTASRLGPNGWLDGVFAYGTLRSLPASFREIADFAAVQRLAGDFAIGLST
ncbi:MAG: hypothetical protein WCY29_17545 [Novosphingobium sp.]